MKIKKPYGTAVILTTLTTNIPQPILTGLAFLASPDWPVNYEFTGSLEIIGICY